MISQRRAFVLKHTRLQRPAFVPELQLYLADEITPLWRLTAAESEKGALPFWAFAWVGGLALARYLLDHPGEVAGKRALDFAAGSGLCALAAMKAGAAHTLAADVDAFSAEAVALNADVNGVGVTFTGYDLLDADPPPADLILAGDICYEQPLAVRVLTWLQKAHERGARVLIGDPGRAYFPHDSLICLSEYKVPASRELEDAPEKQSGVYTFPPCRRYSRAICYDGE